MQKNSAGMMGPDEWNAVSARRALLRQQTELIGPKLPWLVNPALIPDSAVAACVGRDDVPLAAFSLAGWMLIEIVRAADQVHEALDWKRALDRFRVVPALQESVMRAVLSPASRHAPGLFAMAEIISVIPHVASRAGVPSGGWGDIAARSEAFGAKLARDNTAVQVLLRNYLSRPAGPNGEHGIRMLNPALLRLDEAHCLTTVTPLDALLTAARDAAARHGHSYQATCVALQAPAPEALAGATAHTMFGAIWSSFAQAAGRLVFPRFDTLRDSVPPLAAPDLDYVAILGKLAAQRPEMLSETASQPYPAAVEHVLKMLLETARS